MTYRIAIEATAERELRSIVRMSERRYDLLSDPGAGGLNDG